MYILVHRQGWLSIMYYSGWLIVSWLKVEGVEFYSSTYTQVQLSSLGGYAESLTLISFVVFLFLVIENCKSVLKKWTSTFMQSVLFARFEFIISLLHLDLHEWVLETEVPASASRAVKLISFHLISLINPCMSDHTHQLWKQKDNTNVPSLSINKTNK